MNQQPQGILNKIGGPGTVFRGTMRPAQSFQGGTVMDLLNSLELSEDIADVLPSLDEPLPETPITDVSNPLPTGYIPIEPDPDSTPSGTPVVEVV